MSLRDDHRQTFISIIMSVSGFLLFSIADTCVKYLGTEGYHNAVIQLYASSIAVTIGILYVLIHKRTFAAFKPRKSAFLHLCRSLTLAFAVYFLIESLRLLNMAEFYSIAFLIPFLVTVGTAFFFKEHVGLWRWVAILGGFSGVLISVSGQLTDVGDISIKGITYGFIMVAGLTTSYLIIRRMGSGEYPPLFPLYAQIGIFVTNLILIHVNNIEAPMPPMNEWLIWLTYGSALFMAVLLVSNAFANAPIAAIPACFQYTQIIWGVLFGFWVFSEVPQFMTVIGLIVITLSGLFMVWREYIIAKNAKYSGPTNPL
nr:hypothetical protein 15 [Alphaproteobacteria bacterium]